MSSEDQYISPLMMGRGPEKPSGPSKVFTLPSQKPQRPKVQNFSAAFKIDPSWPKELVEKLSNSMCYLCNVKMTSEQSARAHYQGSKHASKIRTFLATLGQNTEDGETKGIIPTASTKEVKREIPKIPPGKKHPISILNENKYTGLIYNETNIGAGPPYHEFECTVEVEGETYKGRGATKKLAKTTAAEAAVQALMQKGKIKASLTEVKQEMKQEIPSAEKSPISILCEKYKGIIFHEKDLGMFGINSHEFECNVEIEGQTYKGVGASKKIAKAKCAEAALQELNLKGSDSDAKVHTSVSPLKMLKHSSSGSDNDAPFWSGGGGSPTKSGSDYENSQKNDSSNSVFTPPKMIRPSTAVSRVPQGPELNPNNFVLDYTGLPKIKIHSDGAVDGKSKIIGSEEDIAKNAVALIKFILKNVLKSIRNKEKEKVKPKKRKADGEESEDKNAIGRIEGRHCRIAHYSLILTKEIWLGRKKYTKAMNNTKLGSTPLQHEEAITDNQVADAEYGRGSIGGNLTMHFDINIWQDTEEPEKILVTGDTKGSERVQTQMMKPMFPFLASMAQHQLKKATQLVKDQKNAKKD